MTMEHATRWWMLVALTTLASIASAQDGALGDPIVLHGVEVRGLVTRTSEHPVPRIQHRGAIRIAVTNGRASGDGQHTTIHVCGADATRTEIAMPGVAATRVVGTDPSHHLVTRGRPATTYVRVEIARTHDGRTRYVTIEWSVPTERREELRTLEDAFFASIRCLDDA